MGEGGEEDDVVDAWMSVRGYWSCVEVDMRESRVDNG